MRITHFEVLKAYLGKNFNYLEQFFKNMSMLDTIPEQPIREPIFDKIFNPDICSGIFGTPGEDRTSRVQRKMDLAVIRQTYHLWKDQNYFDITPQLTSRLIDAELRDVDTFFIKAPFRSMYLSLPKGNGIYIPNNISGLHEVDSIYITFEDFGGPKDIPLFNADNILCGATKHMQMLVCGETKKTFGDSVMFFDLIFFEGKVSDSIERNKEILDNPELWKHIVDVFYFVAKVFLYINCANTSIQKIIGLDVEEKLRNLKGSAKKRKLLKRYGKVSPQSHSLLDIVIDKDQELHKLSSDQKDLLGSKSLERVRMHFKTQRYGVGLANSKIILVDSYIRGDGAEFFREKKVFRVT
jgi:hypothetical protein